jgi:phospholipid/cholesterol/gamma-HCH transport system substrate-binding protein
VRSGWVPMLAGLATFLTIALLMAFTIGAFRGSFTPSSPVTVLTPRAGLVMNNDARVTMRGVEVGKVDSIEARPDGVAVLHLAMDPAQLHLIPGNVGVEIAAPTVFGAKYVQLTPPDKPSPQPLRAGQVLDARHVTVEINTIFDQLNSVLSSIDPAKMNETLGTLAKALNGRGQKLGEALVNLDEFFGTVNRSLPALDNELTIAPDVFGSYADAAPDLVKTAANATRVAQTVVDEQGNLDAFLVSMIGLADVGNDVIGGNRQALTDVVHLLVPTTDLANKYNEGLWCSLAGLMPLAHAPPMPLPSVVVSVNFTAGVERYRYPQDLPKVAATGGPHCKDMGLPAIPFESRPPFLVTDIGNNPWAYGNQGVILNSDGLKQFLFGPIDGPPRNTTQFGQPG